MTQERKMNWWLYAIDARTEDVLSPAIPCIYVVEQECPRLAQQFGFRPDYDLAEALKGVLRVHFGYRLGDTQETNAEAVNSLNALKKALPKLITALTNIGPQARLDIRRHLPIPLKRSWNERMERDAEATLSAVELALSAWKKIEREHRGGKPSHQDRPLVLELGAIYENGTGELAKSFYNDAHGTYQGGATEFISAVLALCAKEVSDPLTESQIGRMLYPDQSKHRRRK